MNRANAWSPIFVAAVCALSGCGGAMSGAPSGAEESTTASATSAGGETGGEASYSGVEGAVSPEEQSSIDSFDDDLGRLGGDFETAIELSEPNCGQAGELRDAICDLADRICGIADRHPEHTDVGDKCDTGRARCERARGDVDEACG